MERWWESSDEDDPITLEPISSLPFPPFSLHSSLFDPLSLSAYVISRNKFESPLTRQEMTQADCKRLDEHLAKYKHHFASNDFYEPASVSVSEAHALYKSIKVDAPSADQDRLDAIRSVAGMALQNLFSYNVWRSGAVQSHEEGLTIIDDDELVAEASDEYFRSNNAAGLNEGGMDEVFPELSLEATRKGEVRSSGQQSSVIVFELSNLSSNPSSHSSQGYKADIEGVKGVVERAAEEKERKDERRREEERRRRVVEARLRVERAAERRRLKLRKSMFLVCCLLMLFFLTEEFKTILLRLLHLSLPKRFGQNFINPLR